MVNQGIFNNLGSSFGTKSILLRLNIASQPMKSTAISFRTTAQEAVGVKRLLFSPQYIEHKISTFNEIFNPKIQPTSTSSSKDDFWAAIIGGFFFILFLIIACCC